MEKSKLVEKDNITSLLLPSLMGIIACMFSLVGLTFAWFYSNMTMGEQSIIAANFDVDAEVYLINDMSLVGCENGIYTLESGTYKINLKRSGSSINSSGYVAIKIGENNYSSEFLGSEALEFTLILEEKTEISFKALWGNVYPEGTTIIKNGDALTLSLQENI